MCHLIIHLHFLIQYYQLTTKNVSIIVTRQSTLDILFLVAICRRQLTDIDKTH